MILRIGIFYVLTYFFLMLLGGTSQAVGIPPEIGLAQWGPGIAGLLMLLLFRKDQFRMTFISSKTSLTRYLLVLVIPALAAAITYGITQIISFESTATGVTFASPLLALLLTPFGALGEEIGWRGYLHKRLDMRMTGFVSSIIVGLLWMLIHLQLLMNGFPFILFLIPLFISYTLVMYALLHDNEFSILAATLFHLSINYTNLLFLNWLNDTAFMAIYAGVWSIIAFVVVVMNRRAFFTRK